MMASFGIGSVEVKRDPNRHKPQFITIVGIIIIAVKRIMYLDQCVNYVHKDCTP